MQPFATHTGLVAPLDRVNVDTDQIMPKQFLKRSRARATARVLFYDWRYLPGDKPNPDFVLNLPRYQGRSVLLARANFGCGSSREHAPWALLDYGFRVVIAPSFADIFLNNCFKNGILPITLPEAQIDELFRRTEADAGYQPHGRSAQIKRSPTTAASQFHFEIDPFHKQVPARRARRYRHHAEAGTRNRRLRKKPPHRHDVRTGGLQALRRAELIRFLLNPYLVATWRRLNGLRLNSVWY